jgi:hypothetical protein
MWIEIVCLDGLDNEVSLTWEFWADRLPLWHEVEDYVTRHRPGLQVESYRQTECPLNYN